MINKDIMPPNVAENLAMWDAKIAETEEFLKHNPDARLIAGARDLLNEYRAKREKVLDDFQNPPASAPPPPTPELIKLVSDTITAMLPQFVAQVVMEVQSKRF